MFVAYAETERPRVSTSLVVRRVHLPASPIKNRPSAITFKNSDVEKGQGEGDEIEDCGGRGGGGEKE